MTLSLSLLIHTVLQIVTAMRALTRPGRQPTSRAAWLLLIASLPVVGMVLYFLFGETSIGGRVARRMGAAAKLLDRAPAPRAAAEPVPDQFHEAFRRAGAVNGFLPLGGNAATIPPDENAAIDALIADIDAAARDVHLLFYIWLSDRNGRRVLDAVRRASERGVTCRLLIDGLGSRRLAASARWRGLRKAKVKTAITFKTLWLPIHIFFARIDLRNHRKIAVIDGRIGYVGSQNCADPEFRVKKRFAPWVDVMMRLEGPVVGQLQHLFAIDWMTHAREDISALLDEPTGEVAGGFPAIAVGSGPNIDSRAVSDLFAMLLTAARDEVVITTPYFVPDETLLRAICGAALRGVRVTMILPARNDSLFVAHASRSYYGDLLRSGVTLAEYEGGLLHAKTMTVDGAAALIGSANMDRRSFELNYENNVLLVDSGVTAQIRARQEAYLLKSHRLAAEDMLRQRWYDRALNNLFATMGPLL